MTMKKATLNDGNQIPVLGLGTWLSKPGEVYQAVRDAIDIGYRHFDCAHVYSNEAEVGEAFKTKFDEKVVKREDLFVTSKLWNTFHRQEMVETGLKTTLKNLKLDYLDLYLIHWPMPYKEGEQLFPTDTDGKVLYGDADYVDTWKGMEKMVELKLTKSIGVSNFNSKQIGRILEIAKIKPVMNQVECHPYLNQRKLMNYCAQNSIVLTAYSPLGAPNRPSAKPGEPKLMDDPNLKTIADKYKKNVPQILIRYQIDRGNIVIPKSVHKDRLANNFDVFDFELSPEDMRVIDSFDCNGRLIALENVKDSPHYPFNVEF